MLGPLLAVLLLASSYHAPVSTGNTSKHCGYDTIDSSGVEYYAPADRWFNLEQHHIEVFDGCTRTVVTNNFACNGNDHDHEGIANVNEDVVVVQSEDGGGICVLDPADILDGGSVTPTANYSFPHNDSDCGNGWPSQGGSEGITFVRSNDATYASCIYGGYFLAQDQVATTPYIYQYCLTQNGLDCMGRSVRPSCNGSNEAASLGTDAANNLLYVGSDDGNATCVMTLPEHPNDEIRVLQTIADPNTGRSNNTFEGMAFGNGKFAMVDDGQPGLNDSYNGFWLFDDSYEP